MPGVETFVSAEDVPGSNITGPVVMDEEVFASEKVTCVGQIVGAVLADTQEHAQRAAKAVVVQYEDLEPKIITIEDAILHQSFFQPIYKIEKGNLEEAFEKADQIIEGELRIGGQEHFYLETCAAIVVPHGEDGEMEIFCSTQNPTKTQILAAKALGVPANRVVCRVKRMGGGFGGKETRTCVISSVCAVAADKVGRPVRIMLDRDEDMVITGTRHPFLGRYKVGFMGDGRILALDISLYSNAGNSVDLSSAVMNLALVRSDGAYTIPSIRAVGYICKTNTASNTAFRGFGSPQALFFAESWISDVAIKCGISQLKVREINMNKEGDLTHYNMKLERCQVQRCWEECLKQSDFHTRRRQVDRFNG
ncbi:xanthine dehydrogenase/oxidase-like [Branchiostoma lanceolatum]|uniref:xanthine dehydrogenase/oxidase-like n=1 Tax=Branchiostoma lanceolatum TaxID=7740 RepID=UPI0034550BF8